MRAKDFNTGLRGVLFEARHYERMGQAVWLYGWLVLRQTRQEGAMGLVLGGRPVSYREIEEETGFHPRTLERWMRVLRREGYIATQATPGGVVVRITKAKKFPQGHANHRGWPRNSAGGLRNSAGSWPQIGVAEAAEATKNREDREGIRSLSVGEKNLEILNRRGFPESREVCQWPPIIPLEKPCSEKDQDTSPLSIPQAKEARGAQRTRFEEEKAEERQGAPVRPLWRAETRDELVRRELAVGTGPEARRRG